MQQTSKGNDFDARIARYALQLSMNGHTVPEQLLGIPDLPAVSFAQLQRLLGERSLRLQRLSRAHLPPLDAAISDPGEEAVGPFVALLVTGLILASLSFAGSPWFLVGMPIAFLIYKDRTGKDYDARVLRAATRSERAFCLLYRLRQISITSRDHRQRWYWPADPIATDLTGSLPKSPAHWLLRATQFVLLLVATGFWISAFVKMLFYMQHGDYTGNSPMMIVAASALGGLTFAIAWACGRAAKHL